MVEENGLGEGGLLTFMRRQKLGTNSATFLSTYSSILFITCDSAISRKNNELPLTTVATETEMPLSSVMSSYVQSLNESSDL